MTMMRLFFVFFFFSSRRRHTRLQGDWSSDVCSSDLVVATIPIGQAPQAVIYVPDAVPTGAGKAGLQPLGVAGSAAHTTLAAPGGGEPTSVSLFDQGLIQVLQAAVTGLEPGKPYVLALARRRDGGGGGGGGGPVEPLAGFTVNPAGAD